MLTRSSHTFIYMDNGTSDIVDALKNGQPLNKGQVGGSTFCHL